MATVTPQMVKELREMTAAGMSDCKKALDHAEGNLEAAVTYLREKGLAAAAKKSGRAASEGSVCAVLNQENTKGFLVEVNCETDFVTRNEEFQTLTSNVCKAISQNQPENLEALLNCDYAAGGKVGEAITNMIAKIGENMAIRRFATIGAPNDFVTSYIHGAGKVGVLAQLTGTNLAAARSNPLLAEAAKDVTLQIAAMKPNYVRRESVPADVRSQESEVFFQQYKNQGKPEVVLPKIVASRMETWFKETCLMEQIFVKDDVKTIAAYLMEVGKKIGVADLAVANFVRMELGEGVEKKSSDLASEVAAQIAGLSK